MGLEQHYDHAADEFGRRVHAVAAAQWSAPTPDAEWDVRALVNHVVGENRWAPELLAGRTIEEGDLDSRLVHACAAWFADREEMYRAGGVIADRVAVPDGADAQVRLLAAFGRDAAWKP
jgi:hypothetical protein